MHTQVEFSKYFRLGGKDKRKVNIYVGSIDFAWIVQF